MADLHFLANPARFRRFAQKVLPALSIVTALALAVGLGWALLVAPPDYQQGETVRIMFVHVPSAWLAMGGYVMLAGLGAALLVWRHPLAALMARAAAPVGATFAAVCLLTGSLWGRPMWGTYWVWDARLTSMLLLFFLFLGHIALSHAYDNAERGDRAVDNAAGMLGLGDVAGDADHVMTRCPQPRHPSCSSARSELVVLAQVLVVAAARSSGRLRQGI